MVRYALLAMEDPPDQATVGKLLNVGFIFLSLISHANIW